jgi:anti-sigma factor RsiW
MKNVMNCNEVQALIDAYVDRELDLITSIAVEQHLQICTACRLIYQNRQTLQATLKSDFFYFRPPVGTQRRLLDVLNQIEPKPLGLMEYRSWRRFGIGMTALVAAFLLIAGLVFLWNSGITANNSVAADVLANHIRSLMVDHLTDVISSDKHTVKPWFDGKLTYVPPVVDLAEHGFPLVGGRLDYLKNIPVAALVYRSDKHYINLFIWPTEEASDIGQQHMIQQGYQLLHWTEDKMAYWAVSDLETDKLLMFETVFRNADGPIP